MSWWRQLGLAIMACLTFSQAFALGLGNLTVHSRSGEPLLADVAVLTTAEEKNTLGELTVGLADAQTYQRLGIATSTTQAQLQVRLAKNSKGEPVVRIQSSEVLQLQPDEVFLDALLEVRWSAGLVRRAYTLMVGDEAKVTVKSGDTLTDIATRMLPNLEDANLDQALIALYRANPQAFAGGSIHRVMEGAELKLPSKAMVQSVPKAEARQVTQLADTAYRKGDLSATSDSAEIQMGDRLRVGPAEGLDGDATRRMEELLVQERALAEAKKRIVEIEKNIAELKALTEQQQAKAKKASGGWQNYAGPLALLGFIVLALLVLLKLSKQSAKQQLSKPASQVEASAITAPQTSGALPDHAAKLFASLNLDLPPRQTQAPVIQSQEVPTAETLRVKLNLVRAYITIEDFGAARKVLDEILMVSSQIDPEITIDAKSLIAQIDQRVG